ncbi:MAG: hypothetical protein NTX63_03475 [Candidatus Peregrinibacteria bacterium]|nr:hypothetical protein [Candidatus Peregrinibacteria bacterium]
MNYFGQYNGYEIASGAKALHDVPQICIDIGQLTRASVAVERYPRDAREEEMDIARQRISVASLTFENNRLKVEQALQGIACSVFDRYDLPRSGGIDIGSGATGAMVHQFLKPLIDRSTWSEIDVNPQAVAENKRRHPNAKVFAGSYLHLDQTRELPAQTNIVTGLSSLDATQFVPQALGEIRKKLQIGGFLLHIQDVRPGLGTPIRELQHMGVASPFRAYALRSNANIEEPLVYQTPEGLLSVGELFRRNLGRLIEQQHGLRLLVSDWFLALRRAPDPSQGGSAYYMNVHLRGIPDPIDEVSVVVTLAQRVA